MIDELIEDLLIEDSLIEERYVPVLLEDDEDDDSVMALRFAGQQSSVASPLLTAAPEILLFGQ